MARSWGELVSELQALRHAENAIKTRKQWFALEKAYNHLPEFCRRTVLKVAGISEDLPLGKYSKTQIRAIGQACQDIRTTAGLLNIPFEKEVLDDNNVTHHYRTTRQPLPSQAHFGAD